MYKALIVDDEEMALLSTRHSLPLESHGFSQVHMMGDAQAALDALLTKRYDAAFLDIRMPGFSGLDIIARLRQEGILTHCVIVSGYADFEYLRRAVQEQAFDYCLKPVQPEDAAVLMEKLTQAIDRVHQAGDADILARLMRKEHAAPLWAKEGIPAQQPHYFALDMHAQQIDALVARLPASEYSRYFFLDRTHALVILTGPDDLTPALIERFRDEEKATVHYAHIHTNAELLSPYIRQMQANPPLTPGLRRLGTSAAHVNNPTFQQILRQVNSDFAQDISLQGLSTQYNLNYTYLSELFRQALGVSFKTYLSNLRLAYACKLLADRDVSISEVGEASGFNSYAYFHNQFKKEYGMTPAEYRRQVSGHD